MSKEELKETLTGLFVEMAIIEHLTRSRFERNESLEIDAPTFGLLNYFVRTHKGPDSIAGIAWAFQEEPKYTAAKIAAVELRGFLSVAPSNGAMEDSIVSITDAGRRALDDHLLKIAPDFEGLVAEIPFEDLQTAYRVLHDIRLTLDNLPDR